MAVRKRGIRPLAVLLFALITALVVLLIGRIGLKKAESGFAANENDMPEIQIAEIMQNIENGEYGDIYETTQSLYPSLDSKSAYLERLQEILNTGDPADLHAEPVSIGDEERTYQLVNGDTLLGTLTLINDNGTWKPAFRITGNKSYTVEVPSGMSLMSNGNPIGSEYLKESGKEASNFFQVSDSSIIPTVDIYQFDGLIGEPDLNSNEGYAMIQDVLSGNWLLGKEITDEAVTAEMVEAAKLIAMYPAQDTALANVTAVSDTSSAWYQKYVTLQNYWFTAHNTMEITNETIKAIAQSDDTAVAHISFDYFADNGEVNRTWHCGYQLTFRRSGDRYLVCGTELSSLLNPLQEH